MTAAKRIQAAIRWEGNNLVAMRAFLGGLPAIAEESAGKCHITVVEGRNVLLEIVLNNGDGLLLDRGMLGVARNVVYSHEIRCEDETVH